jgi:hypothetical protein
MYTYFTSDEAKSKALACARGHYQRDVVEGCRAWSGGDIKGRARQSGVHYHNSRENLYRRLQDAGLEPVTLYLTREHNRRVVII